MAQCFSGGSISTVDKGLWTPGREVYPGSLPGRRGVVRPREAVSQTAQTKSHTQAANYDSLTLPTLIFWEGDKVKPHFGPYQGVSSEPRKKCRMHAV